LILFLILAIHNCICGSWQCCSEMCEWRKKCELQGYTVLSPDMYNYKTLPLWHSVWLVLCNLQVQAFHLISFTCILSLVLFLIFSWLLTCIFHLFHHKLNHGFSCPLNANIAKFVYLMQLKFW
jgi:hypothetical protein